MVGNVHSIFTHIFSFELCKFRKYYYPRFIGSDAWTAQVTGARSCRSTSQALSANKDISLCAQVRTGSTEITSF